MIKKIQSPSYFRKFQEILIRTTLGIYDLDLEHYYDTVV